MWTPTRSDDTAHDHGADWGGAIWNRRTHLVGAGDVRVLRFPASGPNPNHVPYRPTAWAVRHSRCLGVLLVIGEYVPVEEVAAAAAIDGIVLSNEDPCGPPLLAGDGPCRCPEAAFHRGSFLDRLNPRPLVDERCSQGRFYAPSEKDPDGYEWIKSRKGESP